MTPQRAAGAPTRPTATRLGGPAVGCMFCREPIEVASFVTGPPDPRIMSAACPNCGLLVSVHPATLAAWSNPLGGPDRDIDLADRLRARRVAQGTRAILDRVTADGTYRERDS